MVTNSGSIRSGRIPELDGLRGIAIALVVYFHFVIITHAPAPFLLDWFNRTIGATFSCGVDLFFVLSGFLIGGILLDEKDSDGYFWRFYVRRACRILPAYIMIIGGFLVAVPFLGPTFSIGQFQYLFRPPMPWYVYATFTQNIFIGARANYSYYCGLTWSLGIEEQFYLTLPLLVWLLPRRWIATAVGSLAFACVAARVFLGLTGRINSVQVTTLPFCRADALLAGVACALLVRSESGRRFVSTQPVLLYTIAAAATLLLCLGIDRPISLSVWAILFAAILLIAVLHPASPLCAVLRFRPLMALGTIAYGLYMIHDVVRIAAINTLVLRYGENPRNDLTWAVLLGGVLFSIGLATLSWWVVEKRFIRLGHRLCSR